jgi:tetratricopeptide (TPR) repeat protein
VNRKRSQAELNNQEGMRKFNEGKFTEAMTKFEEAYNTSPADFKEKFNQNLKKAKAEILNKEGLELSKIGEYKKAIEKIQEALKISPNTEIARQTAFKDNLANAHNSYGEQIMGTNVHEALEQFKQAIKNASNSNTNRVKFLNNIKIAEWDIYFKQIEELLHDAETTNSRNEKTNYYEEAISRLAHITGTTPDEKRNKISELRKLNVRAYSGYGNYLMDGGNFEDAKVKFSMALEYEDNNKLKLEIKKKVNEAQLNFFEKEYVLLMDEIDEVSDEVAVEYIDNLLEAFKQNPKEMNQTHKDKLYKKLNELMTSSVEKQSFSTAEKAAELGIEYFREKSDDFKDTLKNTKKQKLDQNYFSNKSQSVLPEKYKKQLQQLKYSGR